MEGEIIKGLLSRNAKLIKFHKKKRKRKVKRKILKDLKDILNGRQEIADISCHGMSQEEEPLHPLQLLPEDVWQLLFENPILMLQDRLNCYRTCEFFKNMLQSTISKQYFELILPFVIPMLDANDVLNCRRVCKVWNKCIDTFLEQQQMDLYLKATTEQDCRGTLYLDQFDVDGIVGPYRFHLPFSSSPDLSSQGYRSYNHLRDPLKRHTRNPFIGGKVELFIQEPFSEALHDTDELLQELGPFIRQLSISGVLRMANVGRFYVLCMQCVSHCQNLRNVSITSQLRDDEVLSAYRFVVLPSEFRELGPLLHFNAEEQIPVGGLHFLGGDNDKGDQIMIKQLVFEVLGSQMAHITVPLWTDVFSQSSWGNLTRLTINTRVTNNLLSSLIRTKIPNLNRLAVRWGLSDRHGCWLQKLVEVVRSFETLHFLVLTMAKPVFGEVFSYRENANFCFREICMPSTLTTLAIQGRYCLSNFDFLLLFPFIRELGILSETHTFFSEEYDRQHCLDIGKILSNVRDKSASGEQFRGSNVWKVLPMLQKLTVKVPGIRRSLLR